MKLTIISDTHGQHRAVKFSETTDIIIHAGDFSQVGSHKEVTAFLNWFSKLPHPIKILIGGNHDFLLERIPSFFQKLLPDNIIYLENEKKKIAGFNFWGSPITPFFHNWAFNRFRGEAIRKYWDLIPEDIDILITHGPPYGYGDVTIKGEMVGCADLLDIIKKVKPKYHIFGHVHEGYGIYHNENTTFINASCLDVRYKLVNEPIIIEV